MEFQVVDIDGKEFIETDIIEKNGNSYAYLVNLEDDKGFMIRKLVSKNGKIYYSGLDDDNEFDLALMYFAKKHSNLLKNQE